MTRGIHWSDNAICKGLDSEESIVGRGKLPVLLQFIENNCSVCPVSEDCLDGAIGDDLYYTVRGGRLPLGQSSSGPGRPKELHRKAKWKPKLPPDSPSEGKNILERGVCTKGTHGIFSSEDVCSRSGQCKACKYNAQNVRSRRLRGGDEKHVRTHCKKKIHEWIPENIGTRSGNNASHFCLPCRKEYNSTFGKSRSRAKIDA